MAHIEVKVGTKTHRHTFEESDAVVAAVLQRFASTQEPPLAEDATVEQQLEDAVDKIIAVVSRASQRVRLAELQDEQRKNLEEQAANEGGLKRAAKGPA
jgi:hypothetical protein